MVSFCDPYSNLTTAWVGKGFSLCFFYSFFPTLLALTSVLLGGAELYYYNKYGTRLEPYRLSKSVLFPVQLSIPVLLVVESLTRLFLETAIANEGTLYG